MHALWEKLRDDDRRADEQHEALKGPTDHSGRLRLAATAPPPLISRTLWPGCTRSC
ncbi:hypothetical protein [Streptomyces niger]|uniref:hypothetical protein n=1 Tax=Streptomyces niger TaxID=66373 RepID=UPI000A9B1AFD|nr:hypothetical protein [Streptomyces niger]